MTFIDTADALGSLLAQLDELPWIALDTEFVRERTYFAQLCLVQVGNAEIQGCIDALNVDLTPLWRFLAAPSRTVVLHAASQDLELITQHSGACPARVWDSQIAAAMLGLGDQLSYAGLVQARLGLTLDKSLTRTDWSRRPLREAELHYAADDVRHLGALYPAMAAELEALGRSEWLAEDCARLCDVRRYQPAVDTAWQRLRGLGRLPAAAQHRAAALARWREQQAIDRNRPRKWVLADEVLFALAERPPQTLAQLATTPSLPPRTAERHGETWLALLAAAAPIDAPPLLEGERPDPALRLRVKELVNGVREVAETLGVPPSLLAPRHELERLAREGEAADVLALTGWRRAVIGETLLGLLDPHRRGA